MKDIAIKRGGECLSNNYINALSKLEWKCKRGHVWFAKPNDIQSNHWCPYCNGPSKGEKIFRLIIEKITHKEFPKVRPSWLLSEKGNRLEIDGFNEENGLGFEYQGKQHFEFDGYIHRTKAKFMETKKHDRIKKRICDEKGYLILYRSYKLKYKDFKDFIIEKLSIYPKFSFLIDYSVRKFEWDYLF